MPSNWNKGLTKDTNASVRKISETMKLKKLDNFKIWRDKMQFDYPPLIENGDLAELIGVSLGDGHICIYPRSEELRIISNSNNPGFIKRYAKIIEKVFDKRAYVIPSQHSNCTKIGVYQKHISDRLGIPSGARRYSNIKVPAWILKNRKYIVRYLRGLYEAEGCLCLHKPTYTHKFIFKNHNESMLKNVYRLVKRLGFHPHQSKYMIQVSKKDEVAKLSRLLEFRKYR